MNSISSIIQDAAFEYSIDRGENERDNDWKTRVIYSIVGRMAVASLWDRPEDGDISIIHMKTRIVNVFHSYEELYPEISNKFDGNELADEIYTIYANTGVIYHQPNRITVSVPAACSCLDIAFTRGFAINQKQCISGLGTYQIDYDNANRSIYDVFQISPVPLINKWEETIADIQWSKFTFDGSIEYHRMDSYFNRGFWVDNPDRSGTISILRTGMQGSKLYYLYKYEDNNLWVSQLPQWCVDNYEYRELSNACLAYNNILPPIRFAVDGDIVYVTLRYLPPLAEYNFLKLYSWPSGTIPSNFKRICSLGVFEVFRKIMIDKGYSFEEDSL